jgi:hypothetical protein
MGEELFRKVSQNISVQEIGAELLIYDELRHQAFCLNPTSAAIWSLCDGARAVAQIAAAATARLGTEIPEEMVRLGLRDLRLEGLLEAGLLETPAQPAAIPAVSRRAILRRMGAGAALLLPAIAAIVAPTAAEAYSGCADCTSSEAAARKRRQGIAARQDAARKASRTGLNP